MKFKNYITEKKAPINYLRNIDGYSKSFETLYKNISKDCAPYFKAVKGKTIPFLYRNMKFSADLGIKKVRKNRIPLDTNRHVHELYDNILEDLYGFKGRSSALFCSGDSEGFNLEYGPNCIVFPIGKFEFIWSSKVKDSFHSIGYQGLMKAFRDEYSKELTELYNNSNFKSLGYKLYDYANEIIIAYFQGDKIEPAETKFIESVVERIIVNKFDYKDNNLREALQSKNEIMLNCDSYYYFEQKTYEQILQIAFNYDILVKRGVI